jgi:RNA polymerase sigma factor (sigma-70 family)
MSPRAEKRARELNEQREAFKAFLTARVGSVADAEDILQKGLLKAVQQADEVRDETKLTAWFYQLLRHAIIDHHRSRGARQRRDDVLATLAQALGSAEGGPSSWEAQLCRCLGSVVATLKPQQAQLLRRVDLDGESVQAAARALGIPPNRASVTLHRARKELRARLETFCGACARGACLDCDCHPVKEKSPAL